LKRGGVKGLGLGGKAEDGCALERLFRAEDG
jgi:hypothetical protein